MLRTFLGVLIVFGVTVARADDWPMWRGDAARSASSSQKLGDELHLHWTRQLPPLVPAWPDQEMMWFDRCYEPVVAGGRMFVASSQDDTLTAYDTRSGERLWQFLASAPLRFAPVAWQDRVFVGGDDGILHCLDAADGRVVWRHRGGPSARRLLGNERMISMWPIRGAPVVADDTVYYAAGIWPFMGVFLHAIEAGTGRVVWTNDGEGSRFMLQPHNAPSFAGVAPQGALVVDGERLIVPGGRSVPACFDRRTGRLLHYNLASNNKRGGGSDVAAKYGFFFNGGDTFGSELGEHVGELRLSSLPALYHRKAYGSDGRTLRAIEFGAEAYETVTEKDRRGMPVERKKPAIKTIWEAKVDVPNDLIVAGDKLFGCREGELFALERSPKQAEPRVVWQAKIDGTPVRLLAADDRLFVVTLEGAVHCYGAEKRVPAEYRVDVRAPELSAATTARAKSLLAACGNPAGYAVVWGAGDGQFVLGLLAASDLNLIVVEPVAAKADAVRASLAEAGLYGRRAQVIVGTPETAELPPYFASAMFCDDPTAAGVNWDAAGFAKLYESLRPFGGTAWFGLAQDGTAKIRAAAEAAKLSQAEVAAAVDGVTLVRAGALPDSADWTHEHADASNTRTSRDGLVRMPLGVLWFGGPSHEPILPRHGHGPQPQVIEGRVVIEGPDLLRATDVYTGRLLWETKLPGIGKLYDNLAHHPGANGTGANYISRPDGIYAIHDDGCVVLSPQTGAVLQRFKLPPVDGTTRSPVWNYLNVLDDYLVAGIDLPESLDDPRKRSYEDVVAGKRIYVLDRREGRVLWSFDAEFQFRNNAICLGGGRLYCIDLLSTAELDRLKRRGEKPQQPSKLYALDLATGRKLWTADADVFGTWLSYSAEHDVLVEAGRPGRDVLKDEPDGMRAYRGTDGKVLWRENVRGPAILHGDRVLAGLEACDLQTGRRIEREDPLTGRAVAWNWKRNYGCNTPQASQHMLLFRSGAAGYCDLSNDGGTGNFGGFRSSCTNNLIAAGGVLSVPDYTRTCTCDYQNQTSLALVHMPDVEIWTEFPLTETKEIRHLAINLGAPGYRRAADGRLWLHEFKGAKVECEPGGFYRRHASNVVGEELNWVAASGCRGIRSVALDPNRNDAATYTVRLHFCDPDNDESGRRKFDVAVQGRTVLEQFDPVAASGGKFRPVVREFRGVKLDGGKSLLVEFRSAATKSNDPTRTPLLNGIEMVLE